MFHHLRALRKTLVVHHLGRQGDARDRCLQFVRHVVDKVVLYLAVPFLPEDDDDREDERHQQHEGEDDGRNHEAHAGEDVVVHFREMHLHHAHPVHRVVAEEHL